MQLNCSLCIVHITLVRQHQFIDLTLVLYGVKQMTENSPISLDNLFGMISFFTRQKVVNQTEKVCQHCPPHVR